MKKNNDIHTLFNTSIYNDPPKNTFKRKNFKIKKSINIKFVLLTVFFLCLIAAIITIVSFAIFNRISQAPDLDELQVLWNSEDYKATYDFSKDILNTVPFNNTALTYHGYSSFYLSLSSTNSVEVHDYIDEAINSLRLALLNAKQDVKPQIEYMLGKTYFHKNRLSAYYFYADLAIKYLHSAHNNGYNANDVYEYLGLSYASLDMLDESISYFTEALLVNDSDALQLAIAEQYNKKQNYDAAKPYLQKVINESSNMLYIVQCSNMLGQIYIAEENYKEAQSEFEKVLTIDEESADAHYGLGLIYEFQGDSVRARSQWRRVLEIEVNHVGALLKMK